MLEKADEVVGVRSLRGGENVVGGDVPPEEDVLSDGPTEEAHLLRHETDQLRVRKLARDLAEPEPP